MLESPKQIDGAACGIYVMFSMTLILFGMYSTMWHHFTPERVFSFQCYIFKCIVPEELHILAHVCLTCLHWYSTKPEEMVACDLCGIWTHLDCTPYKSLPKAEKTKFKCKACDDA
jgi:PHD-finger